MRILGTKLADGLFGSELNDLIRAGGGEDYVDGYWGDDLIWGDGGDDRLYGEYGNDTVHGGRGHDTVNGGGDDDRLYGDRGNDTLEDTEGTNWLEGGPGLDRLGAVMLDGSVTTLVGGRDGDTFSLGFNNEGAVSWADVVDFHAAQGDKLQLSFSTPDGSLMLASTAETFAAFDSNLDGTLTDADNAVALVGQDLLLAGFSSFAMIRGVDHIDSSMLIG